MNGIKLLAKRRRGKGTSSVRDVIDYMVTNQGHQRHGSIRVAFYVEAVREYWDERYWKELQSS
jgi:hypothetical protein